MKTIKKIPLLCGLLSLIAFLSFAQQEKVLQIFRNGEVIREYKVSDIDYIEVNDVSPTPVPEDLFAMDWGAFIWIEWTPVDGATYNLYRSSDSENFTLLASEITDEYYMDYNPIQGINFYRVKAVIDGVESMYSAVVAEKSNKPSIPKNLYLIGDFCDWELDEEWKFSTTDNVNYVLSNVSVEAGIEFFISDYWAYFSFGGPTGIKSNVPVTLDYYNLFGTNDMTMTLAEGGNNLTFKFNIETLELVVEDEGGEVDPTPGPTTRYPTVTTNPVTNIQVTSATFNGIITDLGSPNASRRGFCYSTTNSYPTIHDKHWDEYRANTINYDATITGLSEGTKYYVRAYAYQDGVYVYGNTVSFTTLSIPLPETDDYSNLKKEGQYVYTWSVTLYGFIPPECPSYTEKGFVCDTNSSANANYSNTYKVSGSGTGLYSTRVTGLQDMQTYYVKAYVKIGGKYYYGRTITIKTF